MRSKRTIPLCFLLLVLPPSALRAQASDEDLRRQMEALREQIQTMKSEYRERIETLEQEVRRLKANAPPLPLQASGMEVPMGRVPPPEDARTPTPSAPPAAALSNPAISLIPDFTASGGDDPVWKEGDPLRVREVEVAFSANIDPYATAFAALSLEDGEFSVEEAYAAFPGLPGGWTMKLGRFKQDFGKQNGMHTHAWFQADSPLALRTFLGDEGLADVGLSATHLMPTPWMSDFTVEVTGGRNGAAFGGGRDDLAYLAAWRSFWDLSDASNLEAQVSLAGGKNAAGKGTGLGDLAVTYRYKPPGSKRESLLWRTEIMREDYRTPSGLNIAWGGFSYVDWQFTRGWFLGARADYAEHPLDPDEHDAGGALVLTYFPSEFQKFRLQWERTRYAGLGTRDALVFEYGFAIGPHGAHPF
jgi:hypothetical protein